MSALIVDEAMLREPRLLMPRQMPLGPIKVNPDAPRFDWGWMPGRTGIGTQAVIGPVPDKNGYAPYYLTKAGTWVFKTTAEGIGCYDSGEDRLMKAAYNGLWTSDGVGTGAIVILMHGLFLLSATRSFVMNCRTADSDGDDSFSLVINGYFAPQAVSSTSEQGTIGGGVRSNASTYGNYRLQNVLDGNSSCYVLKRNAAASAWSAWRDGQYITSHTGLTASSTDSGNRELAIGGHNWTSNLAITTPLMFLAVANYDHPDEVCCDLSRDPYQLFIPA